MVLYTIDCPRCKILEIKLNQANIMYDICRDINKMKLLNITTAPVLEVNNKLLSYKEAVDYINSYKGDEYDY